MFILRSLTFESLVACQNLNTNVRKCWDLYWNFRWDIHVYNFFSGDKYVILFSFPLCKRSSFQHCKLSYFALDSYLILISCHAWVQYTNNIMWKQNTERSAAEFFFLRKGIVLLPKCIIRCSKLWHFSSFHQLLLANNQWTIRRQESHSDCDLITHTHKQTQWHPQTVWSVSKQ